jgi:hypothetical protein
LPSAGRTGGEADWISLILHWRRTAEVLTLIYLKPSSDHLQKLAVLKHESRTAQQ